MGDDVAALRRELRELVADHVPSDYLGAFTDDPADLAVAQRFCQLLADRGLLCMAWPEEWGGKGASPWEQTAVREEMWALHEPRGAEYMGVNWVGPTIMRHGTREQQQRHLPAIARGEVIWCQGFSEPNAGSDLASLQTAARRDGDGWFVSGQKIWTSYATMAQWCFLLARTSRGERKQQGLTIFLVPMSDPGIEVRPIASMIGPHHLNEVFFNDVWVTDADVLGVLDEGWKVVQEVLAFERVGIARYARAERLLMLAPSVFGEQWDDLPEELRVRWAGMLIHCRRARLLAYRVVAMQQTGPVRPGDAAAYRIAVTRLDQHSAEVLMEIVGSAVLAGDDVCRFEARRRGPLALFTGIHGGVGKHRGAADAACTHAHVAMITELSDEAAEFGRVALRALESAGGDRLAVLAEAEPRRRESLVAPVLTELGAWDLDPRGSDGEAEAAAALCRSGGYWAVAYPIAERLCRPIDVEADGLLVVDPVAPAAAVAGLDVRWITVDLEGRRCIAAPRGEVPNPREDAFVIALELEPFDDASPLDVALGLCLPCWTLLGMLDRAMELTRSYILEREQFGQALAAFQGVQFQLTDAEVERVGLEELANYALWSIETRRSEALEDALALRVAALEAAEIVFRVAHQLHGAIGFCDETTLSWVSRASIPLRRLPYGLSATRARLLRSIGRHGLMGLWSPAAS